MLCMFFTKDIYSFKEKKSCYEKEKKKLQRTIDRLLEKRRKGIRKSSDFIVPGILIDTSEFHELFAAIEDENEDSDNESVMFDTDTEDDFSDEESDIEDEAIPTEEVFFSIIGRTIV